MYNTVLLEKKQNVGILTLHRPRVWNAISLELIKEISRGLAELEADPEVRVVVMTGAGKSFSTGHDMAASDAEIKELIDFNEGALNTFEKPLISAIHGLVLGYGLQLALTADIIIAADNTTLRFTGPTVGSVDPGSILLLPAMVGLNRASELLFTCERINAEEAYRIGMVNKVVPHKELMPAALEMAGKITRMAPLSLKYTKRALRWGLLTGPVNDFVRAALYYTFASEDYHEAVRAFQAKQEPVFRGK